MSWGHDIYSKTIKTQPFLYAEDASADTAEDASAVAKSNVSLLQRFINMYEHLAYPWRAPALVYSLITF